LSSIEDSASVCGFRFVGDQVHVTTAANLWIWRDGRWHRGPLTESRCMPPVRSFRMPDHTVIKFSGGKLTVAAGDMPEVADHSDWIVDVMFRSPSPYFSAQQYYEPYPVHLYALDGAGSLWRGTIRKAGERLFVEKVDRLPDETQPLRLAWGGDQLFALHRHAGKLHIKKMNTALKTTGSTNVL
jgi:hypothetical protein